MWPSSGADYQRRRPFTGTHASETIDRIIHAQPEALARFNYDVPAELERIVRKCLEKEPDRRYQSARELLVDLRNLKRDRDSGAGTVEKGASERPPRRHRAGAVLAAALLAVVGVGYYWLAGRGQAIDSLAVLPFVNVGADPATEYLADGITESIISNLSQLRNLKVMSRSSVFRYKGREIDPLAVGRELKVQAVVTGQVVQRGDGLAISLELVDARDNRQIWGEQYQRQLSDILTVQADISRVVSEKLQLRLTGEERQRLTKRYTENSEAYQLYLRGRYHWDKWGIKDAEKSIEYFQQAINLEPNFVLAYTGLADDYFSLGALGGAPPKDVMPKAQAAVARALELDSTLAEAHTSLGLIKHMYDWDFAGAEREFKRGVELNPKSAIAHHLYAKCLVDTGRFDESVAGMKRALELDPFSVGINKDFGETLFYARRYDQAIEQFSKTLKLEPNHGATSYWLGRAYEAKGLYEQAIETDLMRLTISGVSPEILATLKEVYAKSGWKGYWQNQLDYSQGASGVGLWREPFRIAMVYTRLGEKEQALAWLEKAYESRSAWMPTIKNDPVFDSLRSDPRFANLLRRAGFPP